VTGVSWFTVELGAKHVELLHELVPRARLIAVLVNPNNPESTSYLPRVQEGALGVGLATRRAERRQRE
jgi:putative ABC transport system substrate-binding protein